jgi:NTP pyrophosphatase (non-canonical NTP hydrolase)
MTEIQYILGQIAQEASEVAQEASKCQQFGLDETYFDEYHNPKSLNNAKRLEQELQDLLGVVRMLNIYSGGEENVHVSCNIDVEKGNKKIHKVEKYIQYSKDLGMTK